MYGISIPTIVYVALALSTFYEVTRIYERKRRADELSSGWDEASTFCFGLVMGIIWPLTWVWALARRPTKAEREASHVDVVLANDYKAKQLGLGDHTHGIIEDGFEGADDRDDDERLGSAKGW